MRLIRPSRTRFAEICPFGLRSFPFGADERGMCGDHPTVAGTLDEKMRGWLS